MNKTTSVLSIFSGGDNRITLSLFAYPPLLLAPGILLASLIVIPQHDNNKFTSNLMKQILSIPLLLSVFLIPFGFTNGNRVVDLVAGVTNYNVFLRFLELYWIGPVLQKRPVYATISNLWIDFWGSLRVFPKPAKQDTPELKKGQVKEFKKDKKFYHIIPRLLGNIMITDFISAWLCTFTGPEVVVMTTENPVLFFFVFFAVVLVLNSAFNSVGYGLQLFYVIFLEGGSYSSEQWRTLMINPALSTSLDDLWSHRWHQLFKSTWLAFPFRPVRILTIRLLTKKVKNPEPIAYFLASISVFVASALMHEYVIAANMSLPIYIRFFKGEQCIFFIGHGFGVFFEHLCKVLVLPRLSKGFKESSLCLFIQRVWTITFGYLSFYYIMNGFMTWGFHLDNPLEFTKPFILDFVRQRPQLLAQFGSQAFK